MTSHQESLDKVKKQLNTPTEDHRYKSALTKMSTAGSRPKEKCIQHTRLFYRDSKVNFFRCTKIAKTHRMIGRVEVPLCDRDAEIWDELKKWALIDFYTERFGDASSST